MRRGESDRPPPLRARLLGETYLAVGDRVLAPAVWPRRSARSLLLLLLATPGHRIGRERAADLLWADGPEPKVKDAWYQAVSTLRRVLEPNLSPRSSSSYLGGDASSIGLRDHAGTWVDVDAFEAALDADDVAPSERRGRLRSALALYRGDLLADEPDAGWATPRREALRSAWQRGVLVLAELDLLAGEPLATVAALQAVLTGDATAEEVHRALIRAYLAAGEPERARRQYESCRQALMDELDIEPDGATRELVIAHGAGPSRKHSRLDAGAPRRQPPIPTTPLVGRDREAEQVEDLVWRPDVRLVTLTGPGGIGKTRLAIEIASRIEHEDANVVFVPLAAVSSPDLVLFTIGRALGVRDEEQGSFLAAVQHRIGRHELVLVLDNFEHVTAAAGVVAQLLASCPGLTVLATSRLPLHLGGEHLFAVSPLALPGASWPSLAALARSDAVTLFIQRATAAKADFALTEQNASTVARICARLDGLPLAIELAAARVRMLSPRAILARWDHQLELLTGGPGDAPPRLRTMRDAIAWSYDLLDEREQAVFRRLAVFPGGASLPAAAWVAVADATDPGDGATAAPSGAIVPLTAVPNALAALVDHSLVRQDEEDDGEPRFVMLETVRAYAMERLQASGEAAETHRRLMRWLIGFAEAAVPCLTRTAQAAELDRLTVEIDNLRAALAWSLDHGEATLALHLARATYQLWFVRAMPSEERQWLDESLAAAADAPDMLRADALLCAAAIAFIHGDFAAHLAHADEGLALARTLDYPLGTGVALFQLGAAAERQREFDLAAARYQEALSLMRQLGESYWVALLLSNLGNVSLWRERVAEAVDFASEGLARWHEIGNEWGIAQGLGALAAIASEQGDQARAVRLYQESLARTEALGDRRGIGGALAGLARLAEVAGMLRDASRLLGAAHALGAAGVRHLAHHLEFERVLGRTRSLLDARTFMAEWDAGAALSIDEAITEARAVARRIAVSSDRATADVRGHRHQTELATVTPLRPRSRKHRGA